VGVGVGVGVGVKAEVEDKKTSAELIITTPVKKKKKKKKGKGTGEETGEGNGEGNGEGKGDKDKVAKKKVPRKTKILKSVEAEVEIAEEEPQQHVMPKGSIEISKPATNVPLEQGLKEQEVLAEGSGWKNNPTTPGALE